MELIDKDKVVAEIEERLDKLYNILPDASKVENNNITRTDACNTGKYMALESFKKFIDTLETKEVDLEKEARKFIKDNCTSLEEPDEFLTTLMQLDDMVMFAKHFYELGIKTKKGE